ncbi:glycosyltransferase [Roseiarcus sp.]|uniref:glycosyltransferase n=1 Tax=Roseiarcus sp. TaxID=1969460 RepID=UPI003F970647
MTVDPLSPFGRGVNAPLTGRTVLQIPPPITGGGDRRATLAVAEALIEAGARALVVSEPGELASEAQAVGALHVPFPASTGNPLAMILNVRRLARILSDERVDLVHARSRASAWVALGACRKLKRALVTTIPGEGPSTRPRTSFESAVADGDLVVAASSYAAERAGEAFPAARTRLRIVRPGLDVAKLWPDAVSRSRVAKVRESWGVAPHERVVLAPGRLAPGRGQALVVEAAALIAKRGLDDVRFVLAGEVLKASFGRELDALASARGVKGMVARRGAEADRPAAFVGASAVVFPTREAEGVTRAVIEASASGALTIVADVGAAGEIVAAPPLAPAEQRTGWLVPPGDAAALADAIETALGLGASAREAIRRRSRERAAAHYSLTRMTRDTLGVYAEALQKRGG